MSLQQISTLEKNCIYLAQKLSGIPRSSEQYKDWYLRFTLAMIDLENATHDHHSTVSFDSPFAIDEIIARYEAHTASKSKGLYEFLLYLKRNNHLK